VGEEGHPIGLAVNVSGPAAGAQGLTDDVKRALGESGIDPSLLTLEITESTSPWMSRRPASTPDLKAWA
jgi:EAL domain-containing protein (putative c-di-GMP-specific phosphodiesterase class I)